MMKLYLVNIGSCYASDYGTHVIVIIIYSIKNLFSSIPKKYSLMNNHNKLSTNS